MGVKVREKDGNYYCFISHNGKRKAKKIGTDEKIALQVAEKIMAKLVLGDLEFLKDKDESPTFGEVSRKWLSFIRKSKRKASTFVEYERILNSHILPTYKSKPINAITRGEIKSFLISKAQGLNLGVLVAVLSGVFTYAMDDETIKVNPMQKITKFLDIGKKNNEDIEPFTDQEIELMLDASLEVSPEFYPFFLTAARAGLRIGEILALKWQDLQFTDRPFIEVRRSYRAGRFTTPKSGKMRKVDMSNHLRVALFRRLTEAKKEALRSGKDINSLVFHDKDGKILKGDAIRYAYKRILKKAGLRYLKFHAIRHSFASILLSKGVNIYYVSKQMGHSSIQITCDTYGKWIPQSDDVGVNHLDTVTQLDATMLQPARVTY